MNRCRDCAYYSDECICTNEDSLVFLTSANRPACDLFDPEEEEVNI